MDVSMMKPNHLLIDELNYELRIRGIVSQRKDAAEKRKMLARLLERDRNRTNLSIVDDNFDFETEKVAIENTLKSISDVITEFEGSEADSTYKRVISRIVHVTERIKRIVAPDNDEHDEVVLFKNESLADSLQLEVLLQDKVKEQNPTQLDISSVMFPTVKQPPVTQNVIQNSIKSVPVYKWNIHFSGDKHSDLSSFLERIDELCVSRHVSKKELFESATELFSGNALIWFRSIRNTINDWDSLINLMKREFLPSDYVDCVWEQIRDRIQADGEPVHIYIASMENLFARLGHFVAESTKLKYIKRNLLPFYITQLALMPVTSVADLLHYCKKLDEAEMLKRNQNSSQFCTLDSKSTKGKYFDQCTTRTYSKSNFNVNTDKPSTSDSVKRNSPKINAQQRVICWNCREPNHTYRYCYAKASKFCYRCGNPNVTIRECSCSKN